MLRTHYRQPIDWTVKALEEAEATLDRWYDVVGDREGSGEIADGVREALDDDLNTPAALSELHRISHPDAAKSMSAGSHHQASEVATPEFFKASANALGLLQRTRTEYLAASKSNSSVDASLVKKLVARRSVARDARNWAESDRLRDELAAMGVAIKDGKDGTTWEVRR